MNILERALLALELELKLLELEKENSDLLQDKKRLEYLIEHRLFVFLFNNGYAAYDQVSFKAQGKTPREAIDNAMRGNK